MLEFSVIKLLSITKFCFHPKGGVLVLAIVLSNIITASCIAEENENVESLVNRSQELEISNNRKWLALLHYKTNYFSPTMSPISTDEFFLSSKGREDPQQELAATISAFVNNPQVQCKFPARLIFLEKELNTFFPKRDCEEYQQFVNGFTGNSISLVYASGYLGNPASMFGHVFLKFNKKLNHELLDNTYNFGAIVPKADDKLTYIFKGITGGYQGHYANQKYHHHTLSYSETELRDLWEYKLNVSQTDIAFLLAHLWELENTQTPYYFFDENCAYQLAKLLELIIDEPLIPKAKVWVMPYDLIMMLARIDSRKNIIKETIYHGSRQEKLYQKYHQLSAQEKVVLNSIMSSNASQINDLFMSVQDHSIKRIIDTLYDYYAYLNIKNDGLTDANLAKKKKLLVYRFQLTPEKTNWRDANVKPPHESQNTALLQSGFIHNSDLSSGMLLRFRANYYDLLSVNSGRIPYSELNVFDLTLLYATDENRISLRELTLFSVVNLNASQTDLDEDDQLAWKFALGYKPQQSGCLSCSALYVDGFIGKSWNPDSSFVGYAGIGGRVQSKNEFGGHVLSGPEIGGVLTLTPSWVMSIEYGHYFYLNDIAKQGSYLDWEQRFFNDKSFDLRTRVRYEEAFEYAINLTYYW